jgi:hypothetical protein
MHSLFCLVKTLYSSKRIFPGFCRDVIGNGRRQKMAVVPL